MKRPASERRLYRADAAVPASRRQWTTNLGRRRTDQSGRESAVEMGIAAPVCIIGIRSCAARWGVTDLDHLRYDRVIASPPLRTSAQLQEGPCPKR